MGNLQAMAMAESGVDLDVALHWHLTSNHYPPLPVEYIPVAKQAIKLAVDAIDSGDDSLWDTMLDLPDVEMRPRKEVDGKISVGVLVEIMHLDAFVDAEVGGDDE